MDNQIYITTIATLADESGYYDLKDFYYLYSEKKIICQAKTLNANSSSGDKVSWVYTPSEKEIEQAFSSLTERYLESKKWILRDIKLSKI
jgi:hypothetical protein